jgi:hypothetical protein
MATYEITEDPVYRGLPVLACPGYPLRTDILDCLYERFDHMLAEYCQVLMVRISFRHSPRWQSPEGIVYLQKLAKGFTAQLERDDVDLQHVWVCELSPDAINTRIRLLLLCDAQKAGCLAARMCEADKMWASAAGLPAGQGLDWNGCGNDPAGPVNNGTMISIDDTETLRECFYWASDLAKVSPMGNAVRFADEFGCSQL